MIIKPVTAQNTRADGLHPLRGGRLPPTLDRSSRGEWEQRAANADPRGGWEPASEMDRAIGESRNWVVLHDLRLVFRHRTAQIDHLVINRFLEMWVCDTQVFSGGLEINELGECSAIRHGKPYGIRSPFAQNHTHIEFLEKFFEGGAVKLPTKLGTPIKPRIGSLVLISDRAVVSYGKGSADELGTLMNSEQFAEFIKRDISRGNPFLAAKMVDPAILENFARELATAHCPRAGADQESASRTRGLPAGRGQNSIPRLFS
jgi:hypothetical protein